MRWNLLHRRRRARRKFPDRGNDNQEAAAEEAWRAPNLLLVLDVLALTTVGVAGGADLHHVTNGGLNDETDRCKKEDDANPPVPNIRCEHGFNGSDPRRQGRNYGCLSR